MPSAAAPVPFEQNQINSAPDWAAQFATVEKEALSVAEPVNVEPSSSTITVDDLAATAGLLISSVQHETNPKFQNSEFMGLMRRLRDREAVVDGNTIVESEARTSTSAPSANLESWQDEFSASAPSIDKGKGRAVDAPLLPSTSYSVAPGFYDSIAARGINSSTYRGVLDQELQGAVPLSAPEQHNDLLSEYFNNLDLDEEEQAILGKDYLLNNDAMNGAERYAELGRMQADWDALDAAIAAESATKSESASGYEFQSQNPYMARSTTESALHSAHPALPYQVCHYHISTNCQY